MRPLARILVDESHRAAWSTRPEVAARVNPVNPADASYAEAAGALRRVGLAVDVHVAGPLTAEVLAPYDALVLPHGADDAWEHTTGEGSPALAESELAAVEQFVGGGGGLVLLGETEQRKYGNSIAVLAERFGIVIDNVTVQDPVHCHKDVPTWVLAELSRGTRHDLVARVGSACFYRAGALRTTDETAEMPARTSTTADPAAAGLVVASSAAGGRVVVTADSDIFGDDSINDLDNRALWVNLVTWAAGSRSARATAGSAQDTSLTDDPAWRELVSAVERLRPITAKDGSVAADHQLAARDAVAGIRTSIQALAPRFPHQAEHLAATLVDLDRWSESDFGVPDFLDSLMTFRPDLHRVDGIEHLVVFPMYTQNGNPNRNVEAVVTRTFWPDWLAEQEDTYDNPAFVPIEFVAFTAGYDTHSAVLFPETVATRETATFHWGGIFCDREAARFRMVTRTAADTLRLALPPDADLLVNDQQIAQETFVLWDLIHDRTHGRGDLPFDPFMIKQRMPYWMYALEELRCDLTTYRETRSLDVAGVHLGRFIRYAILFDRLFRFPITGGRVRNYDGLGGQIMFAWLHRDDVVRWTDNVLTVDWHRVDDSVVRLCAEVEDLYRTGIDRSRIAQWIAAHQFVSGLVEPHPASRWAKGAEALPLDGERKDLVDAVLPDEFPLNVFYEALQRSLAPTIEATAGITGARA